MSNLIPERLLSARVIGKDHAIAHTTIIKVDNVLDYIYGQDRRKRDFDRRQLTNVAPPLENIFVQFVWEMWDMGILVQSTRLKDQSAEWLLKASLWLHPKYQQNLTEPIVNWIIPVDKEGRFDDIDAQFSDEYNRIFNADKSTEFDEVTTFIAYSVTCALFTINFMNCKNVILEEQPLSSRDRRMEQKHGKQAFRYHLLKVRSASKTYALGDGKGSRDQYSTHIVRGHFKTYTDAAPLMGRFVGTYWWESHVAGRDKSHVVDKDYVVEIPQH